MCDLYTSDLDSLQARFENFFGCDLFRHVRGQKCELSISSPKGWALLLIRLQGDDDHGWTLEDTNNDMVDTIWPTLCKPEIWA